MMNNAFQGTLREQPGRRYASIGHLLWLGVAFIVPIERVLSTWLGPLFSQMVLLPLVGSLLFFRTLPFKGRIAFVLFAVLATASGFISGEGTGLAQNISTALRIALLGGCAPLVLVYYIHRSPNFTKHVVAVFLFSQTLSASVGLLQSKGMTILGTQARQGRVNGLAEHPNVLGIMAAIALIVCLGTLMRHRSWTYSLTILTAAMINGSALLLTGSLSSLLAVGVGCVFVLVGNRATLKTLSVVLVILAAFFAAASALNVETLDRNNIVSDRISTVTGQSNDGVASLDIRQETYAYAWREIVEKDWLVGVGLDNTNASVVNGTVVHMFPLRAWYQGGLALLSAALILTVYIFNGLLKSIAHRVNITASAALSAMVVFGATSALYNQAQYWYVIGFCIALGCTVTRPQRRRHRSILN